MMLATISGSAAPTLTTLPPGWTPAGHAGICAGDAHDLIGRGVATCHGVGAARKQPLLITGAMLS